MKNSASSLDFKRRSVSIVSWNIKHSSNIKLISSAINDCRAEIVLLQEVDRTSLRNGQVDTPAELACSLGMEMFYTPTVRLRPALRCGQNQYGLCILARHPISDPKSIRLDKFPIYTGKSRTEPRFAQRCIVTIDDVDLYVVNTHLSQISVRNPNVRSIQKKTLQTIMDWPPVVAPVLLAGDFNGNPVRMRSDNFWTAQGVLMAQSPRPTFQSHNSKNHLSRREKIDYITTRNARLVNFNLLTFPSVSDHYCLSGTIHV